MATGTRAPRPGWRQLARRQWPLAVVLALLFTPEATAAVTAQGQMRAWQVPVLAAVAVLAVLAPRRPVHVAVATGALIVAETVVIAVAAGGPPLFAGIAATEMAGAMAILATTVRYGSAGRATAAALAVVVPVLTATALRPAYQVQPGPGIAVGTGPGLVVVLLLGLAVGTGLYFRARDRDQAVALHASVAAARQTERLALARELHDLVAHHVTGILVQAKAARVVADADPGAAHRVLPHIVDSGTEAMAAMRRLVDALRRVEAAEEPPAGPWANTLVEQTGDLAADLRRVVERAGRSVELSLDLPGPGLLPPEISAAALRLVTESLTNVDKHAPTARTVRASVRLDGPTLRVEVTDDGHHERSRPGGPGYGLIGMQERVTLLDGVLVAGPVTPVGWRVLAELPVTPSPLSPTSPGARSAATGHAP